MIPVVLAVTALLAAGILLHLLRRFCLRALLALITLFPLGTFALGFWLRLSGRQELVDVGFFFTEFSFLFVYLLFALALLLGQVRYWGVHRKSKRSGKWSDTSSGRTRKLRTSTAGVTNA